jgi:hypothetical protein
MGDYTYKLSLWVKHPDADLSGVPSRLGLPASRLWKKGDARTTTNGPQARGIHRSSYCCIEFDQIAESDLTTGLKAALTALKHHKEYLIFLSESGAKLSIFIGWFSDRNSRDVLDWQILNDMAELRISLAAEHATIVRELNAFGCDQLDRQEKILRDQYARNPDVIAALNWSDSQRKVVTKP